MSYLVEMLDKAMAAKLAGSKYYLGSPIDSFIDRLESDIKKSL